MWCLPLLRPLMVPIMLKRMIRRFAAWIYNLSATWVLSPQAWEMIDGEQFEQARHAIEKADKLFPGDPEITRAKALLHFMEG